jgi:hypothetical protein
MKGRGDLNESITRHSWYMLVGIDKKKNILGVVEKIMS